MNGRMFLLLKRLLLYLLSIFCTPLKYISVGISLNSEKQKDLWILQKFKRCIFSFPAQASLLFAHSYCLHIHVICFWRFWQSDDKNSKSWYTFTKDPWHFHDLSPEKGILFSMYYYCFLTIWNFKLLKYLEDIRFECLIFISVVLVRTIWSNKLHQTLHHLIHSTNFSSELSYCFLVDFFATVSWKLM